MPLKAQTKHAIPYTVFVWLAGVIGASGVCCCIVRLHASACMQQPWGRWGVAHTPDACAPLRSSSKCSYSCETVRGEAEQVTALIRLIPLIFIEEVFLCPEGETPSALSFSSAGLVCHSLVGRANCNPTVTFHLPTAQLWSVILGFLSLLYICVQGKNINHHAENRDLTCPDIYLLL